MIRTFSNDHVSSLMVGRVGDRDVLAFDFSRLYTNPGVGFVVDCCGDVPIHIGITLGYFCFMFQFLGRRDHPLF